jgi:hypothetical protein
MDEESVETQPLNGRGERGGVEEAPTLINPGGDDEESTLIAPPAGAGVEVESTTDVLRLPGQVFTIKVPLGPQVEIAMPGDFYRLPSVFEVLPGPHRRPKAEAGEAADDTTRLLPGRESAEAEGVTIHLPTEYTWYINGVIEDVVGGTPDLRDKQSSRRLKTLERQAAAKMERAVDWLNNMTELIRRGRGPKLRAGYEAFQHRVVVDSQDVAGVLAWAFLQGQLDPQGRSGWEGLALADHYYEEKKGRRLRRFHPVPVNVIKRRDGSVAPGYWLFMREEVVRPARDERQGKMEMSLVLLSADEKREIEKLNRIVPSPADFVTFPAPEATQMT